MVPYSEFCSENCPFYSILCLKWIHANGGGSISLILTAECYCIYYYANIFFSLWIHCVPQFSFSYQGTSLFKFVCVCRNFHSTPGNYEIGVYAYFKLIKQAILDWIFWCTLSPVVNENFHFSLSLRSLNIVILFNFCWCYEHVIDQVWNFTEIKCNWVRRKP